MRPISKIGLVVLFAASAATGAYFSNQDVKKTNAAREAEPANVQWRINNLHTLYRMFHERAVRNLEPTGSFALTAKLPGNPLVSLEDFNGMKARFEDELETVKEQCAMPEDSSPLCESIITQGETLDGDFKKVEKSPGFNAYFKWVAEQPPGSIPEPSMDAEPEAPRQHESPLLQKSSPGMIAAIVADISA